MSRQSIAIICSLYWTPDWIKTNVHKHRLIRIMILERLYIVLKFVTIVAGFSFALINETSVSIGIYRINFILSSIIQ